MVAVQSRGCVARFVSSKDRMQLPLCAGCLLSARRSLPRLHAEGLCSRMGFLSIVLGRQALVGLMCCIQSLCDLTVSLGKPLGESPAHGVRWKD